MNKAIFIFLLFITPFFLLRCTTNRLMFSTQDSKGISNLLLFPTYSDVNIIETRDKKRRSDSFSLLAEMQIRQNIRNYLPENITVKKFEGTDSVNERIFSTFVNLITEIRSSVKPKKVKVPVLLLNILDSLHEDYGMFFFHAGFTRTYDNLTTEYYKRQTLSIATLGIYNTVPYGSFSTMIGLIINRKEGNISRYKELYWGNKNPNDEYVIRSQIRDIILTYFNELN